MTDEYDFDTNENINLMISRTLVSLDELNSDLEVMLPLMEKSDPRYSVIIQIQEKLKNYVEEVETLLLKADIESKLSPNVILALIEQEVRKLLVTKYDFTLDDADSLIIDSCNKNPEIWNENAVAEDLAEYLVSDSDDELD